MGFSEMPKDWQALQELEMVQLDIICLANKYWDVNQDTFKFSEHASTLQSVHLGILEWHVLLSIRYLYGLHKFNKQTDSIPWYTSQWMCHVNESYQDGYVPIKKKKNIFGFTSFTLHCEIQRHECVAMERTLVAWGHVLKEFFAKVTHLCMWFPHLIQGTLICMFHLRCTEGMGTYVAALILLLAQIMLMLTYYLRHFTI